MNTIRLVIGALVVLGMMGLGSTPSAQAAGRDLGCPSYTDLTSAINGAAKGDVLALACAKPTTISFASQISITKDVTLDASRSPAAITFDGADAVQLFFVGFGVAFNLNGVTLYRGRGSTGDSGGAIYNGSGNVTVTNSTFWLNTATRQHDYGVGGGAIDTSNGTLTVTNSMFLGNSTTDQGGAILDNGSTLTITNSTFFRNSSAYGGAISAGGARVTIMDSTFSGNTAGGAGGAITASGNVAIENTIIANSPSGGNCWGGFATQDKGYNLTDTNGSCGLTGGTDLVDTDPRLKGSAQNGGPTATLALWPSSPAIDRIPKASCPAVDQRGVTRPDGAETTCDIGAYEYVDGPQPTPGPVTTFDAVNKCKTDNIWDKTTPPPLPPSSSEAAASSHQIVAGWVFLDGYSPVSGATVRLITPSGQTIHSSSDPHTNARGVFLLRTGALPSEFRVVASGGTALGRGFSGTLTARVTRYQHLRPLYVDPATTLVDRYHALHPKLPAKQVTARVEHLLGVPDWANLGSDLEISDRFFSGDTFLRQAASQGSVTRLMSELLAATDQGTLHDFHGNPRLRKTPHLINPVADFLLKEVAAGALQYVGGQAFSWVLSQLGVKTDRTKEILDQLAAIRADLADVRQDTQDLKRAVAQLNSKISETYLAVILQNIKTDDVDKAEAGINLVADAATKPQSDRETLACGVLKWYVKPVAESTFAYDVWAGYQRPKQGLKSLMQAYIELAKSLGRYYTSWSSDQITKSLAYWETYQALFAQVAMEWQHANGCPGSTGCTDLSQLAPTIRAYGSQEEQLLPKRVPSNTFIDTRTDLMWGPVGVVDQRKELLQVPIGGQTQYFTWWTQLVPFLLAARNNVAYIDFTNAQPAGSPYKRKMLGGFADWRMPTVDEVKRLGSDWTPDHNVQNYLLAPPPAGPGFSVAVVGKSHNLITNNGTIRIDSPPFSVDSGNLWELHAGTFITVRPEPNDAQYWTAGAAGFQQQPPPQVSAAFPLVNPSPSGGLSAGFDVFFDSTDPGNGYVLFGPGPGCTGLTGLAGRDDGAGTTTHLVHVTGDDMSLSAGAILPGTTYSYEVLTLSATGVETNDNNGKCYTVTIPSS